MIKQSDNIENNKEKLSIWRVISRIILTTEQKTKTRNTFANNMLTDIKFSKAFKASKII